MCIGCMIDDMFDAMQERAEELSVQGAAAYMVIPPEEEHDEGSSWDPELRIIGRFHRDLDPKKGENDAGANYAAVAFSKVAEMMRTGVDSGTSGDMPRKGEFGYQGGLVWTREDAEQVRFFIAFSGGTEAQDLEISQVGKEGLDVALLVF